MRAAPWRPPPPGGEERARLGLGGNRWRERRVWWKRGECGGHGIRRPVGWDRRCLQRAGSPCLRLGEWDEPHDW
jgi:hypothetical protein